MCPHLIGQWEGVPVGEPVGGLSGWCGAGRLDACTVGVGDACRRLSHMCRSWDFPRFLLRVGSRADEHGLLDGPGMAVDFLVYYIELFWSIGCSVVVLCRWMGKGLWNVPWHFLPRICLTLQCKHWGSLFGDTCSGIWCLFGCFWGPCPWSCLIMS